MFLCRLDDAIVSAQVHEGEQAEETVVVGVEIAVLIGFVLIVPQTLGELAGNGVVRGERRCREGGNQAHGVARARSAELALPGRHRKLDLRTIHVILVGESVNSLGIEEVLDRIRVVRLPFAVGAGPGVVEGDVHRHTPGVEAESGFGPAPEESR